MSQGLERCLAHTGTSSVQVADGEHKALGCLSPWMWVELEGSTFVSLPHTGGLGPLEACQQISAG